MGTIFDETLTEDVTIDESEGLQTSGVATTTEDNNDDDILLSSIATLLGTLDTLGAPAAADAIEAAQNRVLTFEADVDPNLKFTLKNGDTVVTEVLSALSTTAGGDPITLVWINATTIFGYADRGGANERVAFALVLEKIEPTVGDPGGARVTIVQYEAIEHPDNGSFDEAVDLTGLVFVDAVQDVAFDDFSTAAAGQNLWNSVTDTATGIQLLFTGLDFASDTVNTSDFAIGSNSQSIAIGDGIVVDFVKNQTPAKDTDAKTVTTINFTERVEGPSGGFTLVQTGGNDANRVGAEIFAFDSSELGTEYTDGAIGEASPSQTIVSVKIWLGDTLVSAWDRTNGITNNTDPGVTYAISDSNDDGVVIQGLLVHYRVEFHVGMVDGDDTGKLDRFSVQNVSSGGQANDTFDLGDIRLGGQVGEQADIGSHINFEDDGPSQTVTAGTTTLAIELDETTGDSDHYAAGETADSYVNDDVAGALAQRTTAVGGGLVALFSASGSYGSDLAGTLTPSLTLVGVPAGGLATSLTATHGGAITLFADSTTQLSGKDTDGHTVFTIAIVDVGGGELQLRTTLFEALDNGNDTLFDEAVDLLLPSGALELQYQVTRSDAEGDTVVASDTILLADDENSVFGFDDDGPLPLSPVAGSIVNAAGESETFALDDGSPASFAANFGSDGKGSLVFTGMNGQPLANGALLRDTAGDALTSNNVAITLSGFGTHVLTAFAGATTVFTMTMDSTSGQYTIEMFARIDDGSFDFDSFATAKAGKFSWLGVAGDEFPAKDLLVTGGIPNVTTVNNDADDLAANNQWINAATSDTPAEFLRLDFVDLGISANQGGSDINTIPTATHYDANNVGFTIMQTQSGRPVDVRITAIDTEEGRGIGGSDIEEDLTTGTPDEIIAVTVITNSQDPLNNTKTYLKHDGIDDSGFVIWGENDVIVLNLEGANANQAHLRDRVFVSTDDGFSRLEIGNAEAVDSKDAFAIGDVEVGAVGQAIDLAFNGQIIDGDGDAASIGLVGVTLEPAPVV